MKTLDCTFLAMAGWLLSAAVAWAQTTPGAAGPAPAKTPPPFAFADQGQNNAPVPLVGPQPNLGPPTESEIRAVLERVRDYCSRSAVYRLVDAKTGQTITDLSRPIATATHDSSLNQFSNWTYEQGVTYSGMILASEVTGDPSYFAYVERTFKFLFDGLDFVRRTPRDPSLRRDAFARMLEPRHLDDCGSMTAALIRAYLRQKDERYLAVIKITDEHISRRQLRLGDGTLARNSPEAQTLWLDDLYMSVPFLAQMGRLTGETRYFDDGARQILQMADRMFDKNKGIWDHNFYLGVQYDPKYYWARANGWAILATVELLSVLPERHPQRAALIDLLKRHIAGLQQAQSGTGLWHQLLDKEDSYLETSASAMFAYGIARAVNRGWVEPVYAPVAYTGWTAVARRVGPTGEIFGTCIGTNSAYENVYYYNRPTTTDRWPEPYHSYGPVMLAGAETMKLLRDFEVQRSRAVRPRAPVPSTLAR